VPTPCRTTRTKALSMSANVEPKVIRKQPSNKSIFPLCLDRKKCHVKPSSTARNSVSSFRTPPIFPSVFLGSDHRLSPTWILTIIRCCQRNRYLPERISRWLSSVGPPDFGLTHNPLLSLRNMQTMPTRRIPSRAHVSGSIIKSPTGRACLRPRP
jgi:hypothetical protein